MENRKNIWIISQYTGSPYHGMNYRGYYLAKEFLKQGHSVTIFAGSYSHLFVNPVKVTQNFTQENIDGIEYIWVKTPVYKSSKSIKRLWSMLVFMWRLFFFKIKEKAKAEGEPDEIIISSLSLFPVLNAYLWAKKFKIHFIFEVRDIWPLSLVEVGGFSKYHPLVIFLGFFEKFGYKKAKAVVSVLPHAHLHMEKKGMSREKFVYIPNGISLEEVENYKEISQEVKNQFPKDKFIVGYLGTIGIANAMETFLYSAKALEKYENIHFVLVGRGGEKEALETYARENNLKNVTFIDAIAKIQVQSLLQYFNVAYITGKRKEIYKYGISANKIFDYMYASKPIIYAIDSGENIINLSSCGVTIPSEDVEALNRVILDFSLNNLEKLDKMGQLGKDYVQREHTYSALAQKYIKLMEK